MVGIVLSAGVNKALFPLKTGKPAITSGIDLLLANNISNILVVVSPRSIIPDVLGQLYNIPLYFQTQSVVGYSAAVAMAWHSPSFVVSCDHVFGSETLPELHCNNASVRTVSAWQALALTKFDGASWRESAPTYDCFAGWAFFKHRPDSRSDDMTAAFLDNNKVLPYKVTGPWWDIGTDDSYTAYWRSGINGL